jgi:hypothetical protein
MAFFIASCVGLVLLKKQNVHMLSTLLLVVLGYTDFTTAVTLACIFIIVGSFISSAQYLKAMKKFFFR